MVVRDDPLTEMPVGASIEMVCLMVPPIEAGKVPQTVDDWDYFDGSLLAIGFKDRKNVLHVEGTAVMIGPGLAVSAKHVFTDRLAAVVAGEQGAYGFGLKRDGQANFWLIQTVILLDDDGDLIMFSLRLLSDLPDGGRLTSLPLTARTPIAGEALTIVGFRFDPYEELAATAAADAIRVAGAMFTAKGQVTQVHWPIRDRVLAPFPAIDISCGSHGGMSGGAVFDHQGGVVGVVSRGFDAEDDQGPTLVAWIVDVLRWQITPTWPPGLYPPETQVARSPMIQLLGKEFINIKEDGSVEHLLRVE